jgi:hypothetical protein
MLGKQRRYQPAVHPLEMEVEKAEFFKFAFLKDSTASGAGFPDFS